MSHKIACSLCPHNLPGGRGVTLVRRFVVFHFCWNCYRNRRKKCEAFMDKQSAPVNKAKNFRSLQLQAVGASMLGVLLMLLANGCALRPNSPRKAQPFTLRHCAITSEARGFVGCDCKNPLVAWNAQMRRKVVYCDGKVQQ